MKKYLAECIGTMTLVVLGCGTAMLVGCDAVNGGGYILTALAFGLTIVAMAYSIGNVSGCHINIKQENKWFNVSILIPIPTQHRTDIS